MTSREQQAKDVEAVKRIAGDSHSNPTAPALAWRQCCSSIFTEAHQPGCGYEPTGTIDYNSPVQLGQHTFVSSRHCSDCERVAMAGPVPAAPLPVEDALWPEGNAYANSLKAEGPVLVEDNAGYDAVSPPHYQRGPVVKGDIGSRVTMGRGDWEYAIQCIDVMRAIQDPRLATALKYIWRVAFGGKSEPWDSRTSDQVDARDISSAIWYLQDYLEHPPQATATGPETGYNASQED